MASLFPIVFGVVVNQDIMASIKKFYLLSSLQKRKVYWVVISAQYFGQSRCHGKSATRYSAETLTCSKGMKTFAVNVHNNILVQK